MRLVLREEARIDALEAFAWYETEREGLGSEFRDALEATLSRIVATPLTYAAGVRGLRHAIVRRFPYAVYFRTTGDVLVVVAVFHGSRNPRLLKARG